nr:Chitin binding protein domain containing protein [Haemonchus contortus]
MRILLLLTLIGLAVGLGVEHDCDGRVNGVYATSPCSNEFNHCYNGQVTIKTCPRGLVFNPDSNQCDFDSNVSGCAARAEVTCHNRKDGTYTIGCSSSFFFCSNGIIHMSTCQNGLFYDVDRKTCDHKFRVRACGGHPEVEREPVTRPPLLVPTYAPTALKSFAKIRGHITDFSHSCKGKPDGTYPLDACTDQYIHCTDEVSQLGKCAVGEVFVDSGKCTPVANVPECSKALSGDNTIDCSSRQDGYYGSSCSSTFVSCSSGVAHQMKCPSKLVFNEVKGHCDYPEDCKSDTGVAPPADSPKSKREQQPNADATKSVSPSFCAMRKDGLYAEECSVDFISCEQGVATPMKCPSGLLFNNKKGHCDYPEDCLSGSKASEQKLPPAASDQHLSSVATTVECKGKKDGYYSNGCVPDYVSCISGVASLMTCPASLVFNEAKGYCDYPENCSGGSASVPPSPILAAPALSPPTATPVDCKGKKDGFYSNGCVPDYVSCVDGVASPMTCPASLVFNEKQGYCDYPESCTTGPDPAHPPYPAMPAQSPSAGAMPAQSSSAPAYAPPTSTSSVSCKGKKDGYYSNGCVPDFVHCTDEAAIPMTCPASLVFNEKKGYCDYPESCSTGPAPAVPLPAPAVPAHSPPAPSLLASPAQSLPVDCKGKKDGYYSNGCVPDFVSCNDGVASPMTCPASLVFNEKKGYCDYPESCSEGPAPAVPLPAPTSPVHSPPAPMLASLVQTLSVDCKGKKDGYYSSGCVSDFVSCNDGVASPMTCPSSLVFNEKKGYCDYPENCSTGPAPALPLPVPAMTAESPAQAYAPPAPTSPISCKGRKDGYYSNGCVPEFVSCIDGVASPMTCPASLVFNEKKGYCDYPESCNTGPAPALPSPGPAMPVQSPSAPAYAPSAPLPPFNCKGKEDGYYSNGCVADFVFCIDGLASPMKCPASLVFNEKKGYCDYPESCSTESAPAAPLPAPAAPLPAPAAPLPAPAAPAYAPPASLQASPVQSLPVDCKGRKDGYYSNGCVPEFVSCLDGVASAMTCPASLVFNEKKGYCDYPESCSTGPAAAPPQPVPIVPVQPPALAHAAPTSQSTLSCKGKKDGYYSNGCVADFVYCVDGVASPMKCPTSLVFNEKKGYCDYPENCSSRPTPAIPSAAPVHYPPAPMQASLQSSLVDCKGKKDGYYSNGCTSDFVSCFDGVASPMKCPASLVFNEKKGYCDYPESCSTGPVAAPPSPVPVVPAQPPYAPAQAPPSPMTPISCKGKKDGYYSSGCVSDFVFCVDGVASPMKCPASLVFNERKGYCDYPESCSTEPAPALPLKVPVVPSQPTASAQAPPTPSTPIDCKGKKDGYYSNGCVSDFVYCVDGVASPMKCPASLVFNEKKGYCDYPESCSAVPTPAVPLPAPTAPVYAPPASQQASPVQPLPVECKGKKDGYYSNGCVSDFVYCVDGVASPMKCPASLVFNEKKGYCDYPESCSTGPAAAPPLSAPTVPAQPPYAPAEAPPSPITPISCKGKKDGYYSNGCVSDFVYCVGEVASFMKCPASLVFNEKKGYCDYPESCTAIPAPAVPSPVPSVPAQPSGPAYAPASPSSPVSCKGRKDGYYSNGCVSEFVYCVDEVATPMTCPASLVFNEKKGYCDYPESCSSAPAPALPLPAPVVPPTQPPASAHAPPNSLTPVSCKGKKDGYYSNGCVSDFVYCVDGVASPMTCPASLVFNEKKGYCDYPESCAAGPAPVNPWPTPVVPPTQPPASAHAPPSPLTPVSCKGKKDGYYSNGCVSDFVYCVDGVASPMSCPASLVFNEKKGYCDYPESCSTGPAAAPPLPAPLVTAQPPYAPPQTPPSPLTPISCKGKKDGYYSNGCVSDFVFCVDGVASAMKCPASLVFNEKKGYCDYPESCSTGPAPALPMPVPVVPSQPSASAQAPPAPLTFVDCKGKKDGYYSSGCVSEFVYCVDGVPTLMKCPSSLVFNAKNGYCDYPEACSSPPAQAAPAVPPSTSTSGPSSQMSLDCTGRGDGYFAIGCSSDFVYCSDGIATFMKCPASLVFNAEKNYCDYPENCSGTGLDQADSQTGSAAPSPSVHSFVCPKPNGAFSNGCSTEYYVCSNAVAHVMLCPGNLVFNAEEGYCDLKDSCLQGEKAKDATTPVAYSPVTSTVPAPPSSGTAATPSASSKCSNLPDGRYGSPCGTKFMICSSGIAYFMNCPADLVFDSKQSRCVYADECGREPVLKSPSDVAPSSYTPLSSRDDCVGKTDGLHSLGCIAEFIQCVDGSAYSLYCPAGLVFVEELGVCDVPSACSATPKHEPADGPMSYEPVVDDKSKDSPGCDIDGYFSQPCASEYFNCVGGIKFVGKCPAGLVFNMDKVYCDYPDNCRKGEDSASSEARPVPSTVINKDESCKGRPDGVITDTDCQHQFTTCSNEIAYVTKCPAGLVYSVKAKLCDYPEACGTASNDSVISSTGSYPVQKTTVPSESVPHPTSASVQYQHSVVGKDLCAGKSDGPLNSTNCRPSFSFCVSGALYSTICPEGLLFSFASRRCEWRSECEGVVASPNEPSITTTSLPVHSAEFDCSTRPNGRYSLGGCVGRFVMCSDGRAYVRSCPSNLVYNEAKGLCDYDCSGPSAQPTAAPVETECVTSVALGRCSSKFWRCRNGKLESAQYAVPPSNGESAATIAPALLAAPTTTTTAPTTTTTSSTTTTTPPIKCVYSEERPAFALDYCARVYGMCTVSGVLKREECDVGFLFDSHLSTCVPAEQCGQERLKDLLSKVTFAPPVAAAQVAQDSSKHTSRKDERCHNSPEGAMKPMGRCRSSYIRCMGGEAIVEPCATTAEVFSSAVGACVLRINAPECHSSPPRSPQPYSSASSNDPSMFCRTRADGLYRNPTDCTGILQCFGGDVFEYPSCSSGLVFNELTSKCDYRDAVPECRQAEDDKNVEHGCRGASHGDLVPDESDCQQFYRCVWNRLESMRCPSGTVFNPKLSVCDWPDNVPQCSAQQDESAVKVY